MLKHLYYTSWSWLFEVCGFNLLPALDRPPAVLLAFPRSGSNWAGSVLSSADNALYLSQPFTQTIHRLGMSPTLVDPFSSEFSSVFKRTAHNAFRGLPTFGRSVVMKPEQWSLLSRFGRRVLVKEVNLKLAPLLAQFQPRVIVLIRHPAAVALSHQRLKWMYQEQYQLGMANESCWRKHGRRQAWEISQVLNLFRNLQIPVLLASYESLCRNPHSEFRKLFEFAGLIFSSKAKKRIAELSSTDDAYLGPYSIKRPTTQMPDAWVGKVSKFEFAQVIAGWRTHATPQMSVWNYDEFRAEV